MRLLRRRPVRPEIAAEVEQSRQARIQAEAGLERTRERTEQTDQQLTDVLRQLNASNGFAELLVREVIRGSG
ncbi:hypothetical protein ACFYOK_04595 [Microbispora bryophytorum]|uniref:DUF7620 family protein n=1 Tax=Microbispora bryophytorum TaxID=1460882 RepID=UPI0033C7C29D